MEKRAFSALTMVFVIAVIGGFVISNPSFAAEFSADMIHETDEGTVTGKVYIKGKKIRQEVVKEGEKAVMIMRLDKGIMWNLMPEERIYMEMPGMGDMVSDPEYEKKLEQLAEKKHL